MSSDHTYRQVTLPGPAGPGGERGGDQPRSWSARRTVLTVVTLLLVVGGVCWWASPDSSEPRWWEPEGQQQLASPARATAVDLPSTDRALEALDGWEQKSWSQKIEATRVIREVFELGGVNYVIYVDVNHVVIREYLETLKRGELVRRAAAEGQGQGQDR